MFSPHEQNSFHSLALVWYFHPEMADTFATEYFANTLFHSPVTKDKSYTQEFVLRVEYLNRTRIALSRGLVDKVEDIFVYWVCFESFVSSP
jgi:hypothetical protein